MSPMRLAIEKGGEKSAFQRAPIFNEMYVLEQNRELICKSLNAASLQLLYNTDIHATNTHNLSNEEMKQLDQTEPGKPHIKVSIEQ
jgi:hypothetical protein